MGWPTAWLAAAGGNGATAGAGGFSRAHSLSPPSRVLVAKWARKKPVLVSLNKLGNGRWRKFHHPLKKIWVAIEQMIFRRHPNFFKWATEFPSLYHYRFYILFFCDFRSPLATDCYSATYFHRYFTLFLVCGFRCSNIRCESDPLTSLRMGLTQTQLNPILKITCDLDLYG